MITKFKAWDKINHKMWKVQEIDFRNGIVKVESFDSKPVYNCISCGNGNKCFTPFLRLSALELLQFSNWQDKFDQEIYAGDIVNLINEDGKSINVLCKFGTVRRYIFENEVDINGFYFESVIKGYVLFR